MLKHSLSLICAAWAIFQQTTVVAGSSEEASFSKRQASGNGYQTIQDIRRNYDSVTRQLLQQSEGSCSEGNVTIRKEWGNMDSGHRQRYIDGVYCLANRPSRTDPLDAPGAKNRRDDFVVAHIKNAQKVHFSPWLFMFHRQIVALYEKALCDECGYCEGHPWIDWSKYVDEAFDQSPVFDGSRTSLGNNGATREPNNCKCIESGPFSDMTVTLGPLGGGAGCVPNSQDDGLGDNPRCVERDFSTEHVSDLSWDNIAEAMTGYNDISSLALRLEKWPGGLHPTPHESIGGNQDDIPSSPNDPVFWLLHTGLDGFWATWVSMDINSRMYAIPDPDAYNEYRDSRGWLAAETVTLDSEIYISELWDRLKVSDAVSTVGGAYCYMYEF